MVQNLVKAVSGKSYQDYVRQEILEPLGMSKSQYLDVALPQGAYAKSYDGTSLTHLYSFNVYGSGGLFSTPEELSRLAMMFSEWRNLRLPPYPERRLRRRHGHGISAKAPSTPSPMKRAPLRLGLG